MKKSIFLFTLLFTILLLGACSLTAEKTDKKISDNQNNQKINNLTITDATAKQEGNQIIVDAKIENKTSNAQELKPALFALVADNTVLSPNTNSEIPQQIPANTNAELKINFDQKRLEGKKSLRFAYQPINHSDPEQFFNIGDFTINKAGVTTESKNTSKNSSQTTAQNSKMKQITLHSESIEGQARVDVPDGWVKTPYTGGDFGGYKYINPKDASEEMLVVYSACAGCGYKDGDSTNQPDPLGLIPENVVNSTVFKSGLAAGYTYYLIGNPYTGNGIVRMSRNDGYAYAEIVLPDSETYIATKVLNSFEFSGVK